jgi:predicted RNase H-like HicB family nuclease
MLSERGESMRIKVILEPSEEGGYTAIVPSLPGCISEGNTKDEALKNIREAVELYLEPIEESDESS